MSRAEIPAGQALRTVAAGLRADVLPLLEDPHAEATLKAGLGIVDAVADRLEGAQLAARELVDAALPAAREWPAALAPADPGVAAEVAALVASAEAARERDPAAARAELLRAAERTVAATWAQPRLREHPHLLLSVRDFCAEDVAAELGLRQRR